MTGRIRWIDDRPTDTKRSEVVCYEYAIAASLDTGTRDADPRRLHWDTAEAQQDPAGKMYSRTLKAAVKSPLPRQMRPTFTPI